MRNVACVDVLGVMHIEMRQKVTKELYWVFGAGLLTGIIALSIFGYRVFDPTPIDIQLHDTYFVFPKSFLLTIIFIGLLTASYITRGIYFKLDNKIINGILALLLLVIFIAQIMYLNWVDGLEGHLRVLYSRDMDKDIQTEVLSIYKITKGTLWTFVSITGSMLAATGYKTFKPRRVP
jgi:hypothetical protein